jgi:protein-histidine pros-kinase
MKLLKFNLIFIPILALALGAIGFIAQKMLLEDARQHIIENARIIMESALSSRTYTTKQVAPLLEQKNFKLQTAVAEFRKTLESIPKTFDPTATADVRANLRKGFALGQQRALEALEQFAAAAKDKPGELLDNEFHPQSVPAFAATEIFNYLREKFPNYFYKEATLNPTNPRNRATDWESDVVNQFRTRPEQTEIVSIRDTPTGPSLFLARAIKVNNVSCLECHSTADKAPVEMIKLYGSANGFGWKLNDIIGAQIVSVPMAVPVLLAENVFRTLVLWLAGAFVVILTFGNLAFLLLTRTR